MTADMFADPAVQAAMSRRGRSPRRKKRSRGTRDDSGEREFFFQCVSHSLPKPEKQYRLIRTKQVPRKDGKDIPSRWFFDFAWPQYGVIVEIDGGIWVGGAHAHPLDLTRNMEKRNDAAINGFLLLSFTPDQVKKGEAIQFTIRVLATRGFKIPEG